MSGINDCISQMNRGDFSAILDGILSNVPILNLNAVINGAKYNFQNPVFVDAVKQFKNSEVSFFGIALSRFVVAALDILGIEKYDGADNFVLRLIQTKCAF